MKTKEKLRLQNEGYDLEFLAQTQPQGNFKRHTRYLEIGDGYVACLRLYRYPPHGLQMFWGQPLVSNDSTVTILDFGTEDKTEILKALSRSATEKKIQVSNKAKESDNVQSSNAYFDQLELMNDVSSKHEVMKRFYCRIFVYAPTIEELNKKVAKIRRENGQFQMALYSDEQLSEFQSIWVPTMKEVELPNAPIGTPISAYALGGSYPFNHVKLEDPNGSYYGYTRTSGEVEFDPFQRDSHRTRSFFFVTGNAGMGKSTLLKKMNDDVFARGALIRNFDVSDEYTDQTIDQGGVVIRLDSADYRINPFEVFPTVVDEKGEVDEINSFAQQVEKLKNMFAFENTDANSDDQGLLARWVTDFYVQNRLWVKNPQVNPDRARITGLPHDKYPTLKEFVTFVKSQGRGLQRDSHTHLTSNMMTSINRITQTFETLLSTKSEMFDGVTTFPDLSKEQVVTFNIKGLLAQDPGTFNAQIFSVLSLLSADIIKNGMHYRRLLKEGKLDPAFIQWYYLNIDEVENIITPKFTFGVEFLASMMEQMRKNFCAITMAAPTIKDLIMAGNSQDPYVIAVQKIFSLFQIRFFFQISDDDVPRLTTALGGSTTADELQGLTRLEKAEVLMNINGDRNVQFKVQISADEERRYGGGL